MYRYRLGRSRPLRAARLSTCPAKEAMKLSTKLQVSIGLTCWVSLAAAQTATSSYEEASKLIRAPHAVTTLGENLFGDTVNLYNGTLQFVQVDVLLPGNHALPVAVGSQKR
jgi:hypothetical protein